MKFESIVNHYEYAPSMRKEQQGDDKTKEIRIIQEQCDLEGSSTMRAAH
jgi:hypothetical protein